MSRTTGDDVLKIGSFQYLHVLDTNLNTIRIEIGPKTFTRLEHEKGTFWLCLSHSLLFFMDFNIGFYTVSD